MKRAVVDEEGCGRWKRAVVDGKGALSPQLSSPLATVLSLSTTLSFLSSRLPRRAVGAKPTCPGVPWRDLRCAIRVPHICRSTPLYLLSSLSEAKE